jgi:PAS domain S-box-containing protein
MPVSFLRNPGLTTRVAASASLVFLTFVAITSYLGFEFFKAEFKATIYQRQEELVKSLAANIDDKLSLILSSLTATATTLDPKLLTDPEQAQRFLDAQAGLHSTFDTGLYLIDAEGKLIAESPFRPERRGRNLADRDYFKDHEALKKPYISPPYRSTRKNNTPALRMSSPIFNARGEWIGILQGRLELPSSNILAKIAHTKIGKLGYIYLTDASGHMLLHYDEKRILKDVSHANPLIEKAVYQNFEGTGETVNSYGKPSFITFKRLETTRWLLAALSVQSEVDGPFTEALRHMAIMLIFGLAVLIVIISLMTKRLILPLTEFTEHVATLPQKPDSERLFPQKTGAEIGILVRTFNKMIFTLDQQRQQLQLHQEQLEQLVQERTAELRQAQQIGHIGNWKLNMTSGEIRWSDEIYRILGYQPGQFEPAYERLLAARHHDDARAVREAEQAALLGGDQHSMDFRIFLPDGNMRWVHEEIRAERDAEGKVSHIAGTLQDITERKQVEQALIESREAAEAASRAKSLFLSSMSHELRTPLNAVLGFAQLLTMDDEASEEVRSNAGEIESAGRHLLELVSDLLDLARIESGRIDLSLEDIDPMQILNECHSLLDHHSRNRNIAWQRPAYLPQLRADRIRLRQILLNLLSNAVKYNRDGGSVKVSGQLQGKNRYRISISDNGKGIPADRMAELFQPFNRIGAERGQVEGTGIGLVITKTLVQAMEGEIGVESEFGQGSTFWFELPLAQAIPKPKPGVPGQGAILAAEDHEPNRRLLRQQIEKLGFQVEFACDGNEALQMWQAGSYQLLLTDCNMPVMDGYELAQAIRKRESVTGQHIPIIALTANSAKDAAKACVAAGMDDFLVKPVHLHQLNNTLNKWLGAGEHSAPPASVAESGAEATAAAPAYDDYLRNLAEMLGDDDIEEAGRMLHGFLESARECLQEARDALQTPRNAQNFVRAAHKLKSSARMIGATALSDLCQRAEQAGLRKDWELMQLELPGLEAALEETEERIRALPHLPAPDTPKTAENQELAELQVMLIDDDPFILNYLTRLLASRGVAQLRYAGEGQAALDELRLGAVDVMVCDLNMPGMDGVEFLRHLADAGYVGALIIISGNADLLPTIYELAQAHGLRILGTLAKPFTPRRFFDILYLQLGERRSARPRSSVPLLRPLDVSEGLARGEFIPYFQPKVDAHTLKPYGAEALARWQRADGSIISPFAFVPMMEVHGLIDQLFITILSQTLACAKILQQSGHHDLKLAVNLAASTLGTLNLPDIIDYELQKHQIAPEHLILEITESGLMNDARIGLDVLLRLRLKGIGLSIDDFGTGYSTIDQLRRLPFTELKVDQSFVASAAKNPASQIILQSSLEMARRLNLRTVAEGVENEADLHLIREMGCDVVQGFLVAKPMPLREFVEWLEMHGQGFTDH